MKSSRSLRRQPPNKRLKLTGARVGRIALPPWLASFVCGSISLRPRAVRPPLKREPLGRRHVAYDHLHVPTPDSLRQPRSGVHALFCRGHLPTSQGTRPSRVVAPWCGWLWVRSGFSQDRHDGDLLALVRPGWRGAKRQATRRLGPAAPSEPCARVVRHEAPVNKRRPNKRLKLAALGTWGNLSFVTNHARRPSLSAIR